MRQVLAGKTVTLEPDVLTKPPCYRNLLPWKKSEGSKTSIRLNRLTTFPGPAGMGYHPLYNPKEPIIDEKAQSQPLQDPTWGQVR